jgi:ChpA-C
MKSWAKWTAKTVLVTTGFAAAGGGFTGVALAGTDGTHPDNVSVLSGNQISTPVSIPIDICGNAAALLGIAGASCQGGAIVAGSGAGGPIDVVANACGNAVGNAIASCQGGAVVPSLRSATDSLAPRRAGLQKANLSVGSGNQVSIPVGVPASICGNAVAVLGNSSAGCVGGATVGGRGYQRMSLTGTKGTKPLDSKRLGVRQLTRRLDTNRLDLKPLDTKKLSASQLAGLGALSGITDLPSALSSLPLLGSLSAPAHGGALLPVSTLSALETSANGAGMSGNSLAALAVGALLAGAAALKLAGRRAKGRKAAAGEVSA